MGTFGKINLSEKNEIKMETILNVLMKNRFIQLFKGTVNGQPWRLAYILVKRGNKDGWKIAKFPITGQAFEDLAARYGAKDLGEREPREFYQVSEDQAALKFEELEEQPDPPKEMPKTPPYLPVDDADAPPVKGEGPIELTDVPGIGYKFAERIADYEGDLRRLEENVRFLPAKTADQLRKMIGDALLKNIDDAFDSIIAK